VASRLTDVIVDCHDLDVMADFWCEVLGYERVASGDGWLATRAPGLELSANDLVARAQPPALAFVLVPEDKLGKNRVHVDVTPTECSQADEVERLLGLGARRVDISQGSTPWVVLADPEGNEFCVMPAVEREHSEGVPSIW
jgi:catechol 2,3-dioxygenase-like lactoylglutathione lyase family enzyme